MVNKIRKIKELIATGKLEVAMHEAGKLINEFADLDAESTLILLKSRFGKLKKDRINDLEKPADLNREQRKIEHSILKLLKGFDKDSQHEKAKNINLKGIDENALIRISCAAYAIMEVEKLQEKYFTLDVDDWRYKDEILHKITRYDKFISEPLSEKVYGFLEDASLETRYELPQSTAINIFSVVTSYFPALTENSSDHILFMVNKGTYIGFRLIYGSTVKHFNLKVTTWGLSILKFLYLRGVQNNIPELKNKVIETYNWIEKILNNPEFNTPEMKYAKELIRIFRVDLNERGLEIPSLPSYLVKLI